jgi:hypothetical protein
MLKAETLTVKIGERWYITMGRPGFNLPANNGKGYASESVATAASNRLAAGPKRLAKYFTLGK